MTHMCHTDSITQKHQKVVTIIQSENNIWDRKWQKGEKTEQKAHREKDTVAPEQTKIASREEQF